MEYEVTDQDLALIIAATEAIRKGYKPGWHTVGAALRSEDGQIFASIHIDANVGRIAVCAEPIALANAIMAGKTRFDTIVAVGRKKSVEKDLQFEVVSPCGMCREIVTDYDPRTKVIIRTEEGLKKTLMSDLLPFKYK
ncbi:MAG: cytidine deaminase [Candidatus Thermoplasmatota archaeon]|nr:cytidine deaminase [Candidatus Thermoplasmatota archaeon]